VAVTLDQRHFNLVHTKRHVQQIRLSLGLGLAFFALYAVFDYHVFPNHYRTLLLIRFTSLPVAAIVLLWLTFHRRFVRWAPTLLGVGVVAGGVGLTLLQLFSFPPHNALYFAGMLVLLFFCYGVLMIPFREAVVAGVIATTLHCGIMIVFDTRPPIIIFAEIFIVVSVNIAGAVMVRFRDSLERKAMDSHHRIALQNGELQRDAEYLEERVLARTRELQEANHKLHRALEERTQLLQEVYHRVGNNLQTMGSLFRLETANESGDPLAKLERMEARVRSMASVHAVLYDTGDFSRVSLRDVVTSLIAIRGDAHREPRIKIVFRGDSDEVYLGLEQAVPAALLVNELLSVASQEPEGHVVEVSLSTVSGNASISVSGARWDTASGSLVRRDDLSGHLISALAAQLGGVIGYDEVAGSATMLFPVAESLATEVELRNL